MSLLCRWTKPALNDILQIEAYIAQDNPKASVDLTRKIVLIIEAQVTEHPHVGRAGRVHGTRELILSGTPYIAAYRVRGQQVEILRVLHSAQGWPEQF